MTQLQQLQLDAYHKYYKKSPICMQLQNRGCSIVKAYDMKFDREFISKCIEPEQCLNYPNSFVEVIRENEQLKSYIDEGLIETYSLENTVKWHQYQCKKHLTRNQLKSKAVFKHNQPAQLIWKEYNFINYDKNSRIAGILSFYIPVNDTTDITKLVDDVTSWHNVTGYDLSEHSILKLDDENGQEVEVLKLTFEARFFKKDIQLTDWLFHVTDLNAAKKIVDKGIVPKSKNNIFKYNDRVYLFNDTEIMQLFLYICAKAKTANMQLVMFRISSRLLQDNVLYKNGKMRFYVDPKYDVKDIAIYTHNNIPNTLLDSQCILLEVNNGQIVFSKQMTIDNIKSL